ncbi:hypothetical protein [Arthrobacter wenxiniae]|uniref:Uncharacterized protein n=1 Tax=Arthrobacter wenxiniae TaxID=2713570 RepID=A0A7Y7IIK4_9MICC|nr:hypothetical protein [Arthrobacter wenxiniae]NVM96149.1 hypothetical protein [Arthrobacter wenxiniae]
MILNKRKVKLIIRDLPDVRVEIWFEKSSTGGASERIHSISIRNDMSVRLKVDLTSSLSPPNHVAYLSSQDNAKWRLDCILTCMSSTRPPFSSGLELNPNEVHNFAGCDNAFIEADFCEFSALNGSMVRASRLYHGEDSFAIQ